MRRIFTLLVGCIFITTLSAQNFTKFDAVDNNGVKALNGLAFRSTNITILVPESFDLSNVVLDCAVATTDEIETNPLPTDFTTPQTIVTKTTATGATKTWTVDFKKVKSTTLPFSLSFSTDNPSTDWTVDTQGWAGAALDPGKPTVARYGNTSVTFITVFSDAASKVSFDLQTIGQNPFGEQFDVLSSEDGITWKNEMQFTASYEIPKTETSYDFIPTSGVRFVKWVFTKRASNVNVNLNNISIEKSSGTIIINEDSTKDKIYVSNNEIVLSDASSVSKLEVYNVIGSLVQTVNNPGGNINLSSLGKGIYVAKGTFATGKSTVLKFIVK